MSESLPSPGNVAAHGSGRSVLQMIRRHLHPLAGASDDPDGLMEMIGDANLVFLGGATHGTREFHRQRARITRRLITRMGFNAVVVEAGWPDACRANRFVRVESGTMSGADALSGFKRFPSWMWRNTEVFDFLRWLGKHNESVWPDKHQAGFYGMDLFSLHQSMNEVIAYLDRTDPKEAAKARNLFSCTDRFGRDPQNYGLLAGAGVSDHCRAAVIRHLTRLRTKEAARLANEARSAADADFTAGQNARIVENTESFYRKMFRSYASSWNLREEHMMEMLAGLIAHLESTNGRAKIAVWAHNSHVGDARATGMSWHGETSLGQLARERFPGQCRLIGFTTYAGTVTAASGWRTPAECKPVEPALEGSYEKLFHLTGTPGFWLDLRPGSPAGEALAKPRLERAIGIVYQQVGGHRSPYFEASLSGQFDAVIHLDITHAVEPLERTAARPVTAVVKTHPAKWHAVA